VFGPREGGSRGALLGGGLEHDDRELAPGALPITVEPRVRGHKALPESLALGGLGQDRADAIAPPAYDRDSLTGGAEVEPPGGDPLGAAIRRHDYEVVAVGQVADRRSAPPTAASTPLTVSGPLGIVVRAWELGGVGMALGPLSLMIWGVLPPVSSGAPDR
jgi:hypothetical protein